MSKTNTIEKRPTAARTFLLEPVKQRIDGAIRYGPMHYIFPPNSSRASIWETGVLADEILQRLDRLQYDPALDYIIITGHQISIATMVACITAEYGEFRALFFDMSNHQYVERLLG